MKAAVITRYGSPDVYGLRRRRRRAAIAEAYRYVETGQKAGIVVVAIDD